METEDRVNLLAVDDPFDLRDGGYGPDAPDLERIPFPEYPTYADVSREIADHVLEWLTDAAAHGRTVALLEQLKQQLAHGGASHTAANYILDALTADQDRISSRAA